MEKLIQPFTPEGAPIPSEPPTNTPEAIDANEPSEESQATFNVSLPDGTVINGIPIGTTKEQIRAKFEPLGYNFSASDSGITTSAPKGPFNMTPTGEIPTEAGITVGGQTPNLKQAVGMFPKEADIPNDINKNLPSLFGMQAPAIERGAGNAMLGFTQLLNTGNKNIDQQLLADTIKDSRQAGVGTGVGGAVGEMVGDPRNYMMALAAPAMATPQGRAIVGGLYGATEGSESPDTAQQIKDRGIGVLSNAALFAGAPVVLDKATEGLGVVKDAIPQGIKDLLANESGVSKPISGLTSKLAPTVDPRIAKMVQDASTLGIEIPAQVFAPGSASKTLNKVGLMSDINTKPQVTTALSKLMGHEGTPNLDVDTMSGIQRNIGDRMNNFALQADKNGGIPVSGHDLDAIASESNADDSKVGKLIQRIKDRVGGDFEQFGTLSGSDYQALTKKGSLLDKAMNSSDGDLADTAREIRAHLDSQLEKSVPPEDLEAFREARRQYRTMKVIQPLVESGGVTGQPDSASKLFNAVSRNYGSIQNALKYNPDLGRIAQIVNEFPDVIKDVPKTTFLGKAAKIVGGGAAPIAIGTVGGIPAAASTGAVLPAAYGVGKYLSSPAFRESILEKSLPKEGFAKGGIVPEFTHKQWASYVQKYGRNNNHAMKDKKNKDAHKKAYEMLSVSHATELKTKLDREPKAREIEMAHYVGPNGVHRLLKQKNGKMPAHKMFPEEIVKDQRDLFFNKNKPYTVEQLKAVL